MFVPASQPNNILLAVTKLFAILTLHSARSPLQNAVSIKNVQTQTHSSGWRWWWWGRARAAVTGTRIAAAFAATCLFLIDNFVAGQSRVARVRAAAARRAGWLLDYGLDLAWLPGKMTWDVHKQTNRWIAPTFSLPFRHFWRVSVSWHSPDRNRWASCWCCALTSWPFCPFRLPWSSRDSVSWL